MEWSEVGALPSARLSYIEGAYLRGHIERRIYDDGRAGHRADGAMKATRGLLTRDDARFADKSA